MTRLIPVLLFALIALPVSAQNYYDLRAECLEGSGACGIVLTFKDAQKTPVIPDDLELYCLNAANTQILWASGALGSQSSSQVTIELPVQCNRFLCTGNQCADRETHGIDVIAEFDGKKQPAKFLYRVISNPWIDVGESTAGSGTWGPTPVSTPTRTITVTPTRTRTPTRTP